MATSARELVGWTEQRWTAVEESVKKALARTAKCRRVIPIGAEQIGAKTVVVPTIGTEKDKDPVKYGPETVTSPIQIFVDAALDDQHADDEAAVFRLVEFAAAQLGLKEDRAIIHGIPKPKKGTGAEPGFRLRTPELHALSLTNLTKNKRDGKQTRIGAKGAPNAAEIVEAVRTAQGELETSNRPGPCGLLLHSHLFARLLEVTQGGTPYLQQVEQLIDSNEIAGTSALGENKDGQKGGKRSDAADKESNATDKQSNATGKESNATGKESNATGKESNATDNESNVCGILFRLEPVSVELVQTARPTVTVLGRKDGHTELRVEEDLVLRILDKDAIHQIVY